MSCDAIKCLLISAYQCCSIWSGTIINVLIVLSTDKAVIGVNGVNGVNGDNDNAIYNAIIVFPVPGGSIKIPPLKLCNGISLSFIKLCVILC